MQTAGAPQNPAHPEALSTTDIQDGLRFYAYQKGQIVVEGRFNGEVYGGYAGYVNDNGNLTTGTLYELGLEPDSSGGWTGTYCLRVE